jgi:signal transduction histidine kinase
MNELARELGGISVFAGLPDPALEWLAARMTEIRAAPGDVLVRSGDPADRMVVILEGEIRGVVETGPDRTIFTARAGQVTGMLPYSRLTTFPATVRASEPSRVAWFPASHFPEMLSLFPELGPRLVSLMADRIRENTRAMEQREKLAALGKLSAGLAHELNNPSAAARRAVQGLREALAAMREADQRLARRSLSAGQRSCLAGLEGRLELSGDVVGDAIERSDREQALGSWLEEREVADAWTLAADLAESGLDLPGLESIAASFPCEALNPVLRRLASSLLVNRLLGELESSTARVSELVRAMKDYSYMDQGPEQEVDVHEGLETTLVMLRYRLKKGINVIRDYDRALPRLCARGSELNQVWTNLIDNAIEAMDGIGELRIRTSRDLDCALVEITDTGPGIPAELQPRVFEPFFTTKPVGSGTGLGLDIVHRILRSHRGEIRLHSRPGKTTFQVWLPFDKGARA